VKDFVVGLVAVALAGLIGCTKAGHEDAVAGAAVGTPIATSELPVLPHVAAGAVAGAAAPTKQTVVDVSKKALTLDRYERLILNLDGCKLERYQIDTTCGGMEALAEAIQASSSWSDRAAVHAQIGARLIAHRSPAVRVKAAELLAGAAAGFDALADAAAKETDGAVLQAFVRTGAPHGAASARVGGMLLAAADHADKDVRLQAILAIASPHNKGMAGGAAKLAAIAERDPERPLRRAACEHGGRLGDAALIPLYEKLTADASDRELYTSCMEGLVAMFHNHPSFDTANEDAYRLFLRRITESPRSEHAPPWSVMSTFCYFSHESDLSKLTAWKAQTAPWFDAAAVRKALASVVADRRAGWMARTASIESLVGLGATASELAALQQGYDPANAADKQVLDKLAAAMAGKK
jgi:hypothetical protein